MRLEQIKYFIAIAQYNSISLAASELHISQPSISVGISDLEEELGVKLFERTRRGTILCEEAKPLLDEAWQILYAVERFMELGKKHNELPKKLTITHVASLPKILLSNFFFEFRKKYETINIDIAPSGIRQIIKNLQEWNSDIGIVTSYTIPEKYRIAGKTLDGAACPIIFFDDERYRDQFHFAHLYSSSLGVCMSAKRAEKYGDSVSLMELNGVETLLSVYTYADSLIRYLSPVFPIFSKENISMYIRDYATLFELCKQDAGIAVVNESIFATAGSLLGDSIRFLKIKEEMPQVQYAALCLKSNIYMRSFRNFFELLHNVTERTVQKNGRFLPASNG